MTVLAPPTPERSFGSDFLQSTTDLSDPLSELTLTSSASASTSKTRPPKPDGPKKSDPFQFGSRFLLPDDDPMAFNAWDHVEVSPEYLEYAASQIAAQRSNPVSGFDKRRFNEAPAKWWDQFYANNRENFFKNRKWLVQEFPVLGEMTRRAAGRQVLVELGCGAGNTMFPILAGNENPEFVVYGADFSKRAVEVVKSQPEYTTHHEYGNCEASVYDLSAPDTLPEGVEEGTVDVVAMIFVFSALAPSQWEAAVCNVRRMLKPGGKVLFRDYGRNDLAQVRFKGKRYLEENFYIRGDGTRVYFFEEDELKKLFARTGGPDKKTRGDKTMDEEEETEGIKVENGTEEHANGDDIERHRDGDSYGGFSIKELGVDKRMLVNRKREIKMYRRWVQAVFEKL